MSTREGEPFGVTAAGEDSHSGAGMPCMPDSPGANSPSPSSSRNPRARKPIGDS